MSSFLRLRLTFKNFELDLGKSCWFLLDRKECKSISDLQVFIQKKLGLNHGLRFFLKETVIPERESIELIRDEDEISIEGILVDINSPEIIVKDIVDKSTEEPDNCSSKKKKKKKYKGNEDKAQNKVLFQSEENAEKTIKNKRKRDSCGEEFSKPSKKAKVSDLLIEEELETVDVDIVKKKEKKKKKSKSKWDIKELEEVERKFKKKEKKKKSKSKWDIKELDEFERHLAVMLSDRGVGEEKVVSKSTSKTNKSVKKEQEENLKCLQTEKNESDSDENKLKKKSKKKNKEKTETRKVKFQNESTVNELPKAQLPKTPHNLKKEKETKNLKRNFENEIKNMKTDKPKFNDPSKVNQRPFQIMSSVTKDLKVTPKVRSNPNGSHVYFGSEDESSPEELSEEAASMVSDFQGSSSKALKRMAQNDKQTNLSSFYACANGTPSNQKQPAIFNNSLSLEKINIQTQNSVIMTPNESKTVVGENQITENSNILEKAKKNYSSCQPLQGTPRNGDKIAYKILELSFSYTPEVSGYKEAEVLSFDNNSNIAKLCLAEDSMQETPEEGVFRKFELPSDDDDAEKEDPRFVDVDWKEVINPVLL